MKQLDAGAAVYRTLIENELAARVGKAAAQALAPALAPAPKAEAGLCACGTRNDADARFCKSCGAKLELTKGTT
jgi:hypothetical protein